MASESRAMRGHRSATVCSRQDRSDIARSPTGPHREVALQREHGPRRSHQLVLLHAQVALGVDERLLDARVLAAHDRHRQPRALPAVVVVDLGDGGPEAALELRLRVQEVAALTLERPAVRQVQLEAEDAHEARRHRMTDGIGGGRSTRTRGVRELNDFALVLAIISGGLWLALVSTRLTTRLRIPAPVAFLIAATAISDIFPGLSHPVSTRDVERIGVAALIAILFDGGLQVGWRHLKPSLRPVALLGIVGTFLTAALGTVAAQVILPVSWTTAAIIGAALAPTDPAVMFSVLARRDVGGRVATILEGEAGANDPVAIAIVIAIAEYATTGASGWGGAIDIVVEMVA